MPLLAYRYAFNNREKLLAVTVDYRKLVAQQPAASRVGRLADWVFSMVFDSSRATVMYMGSPLFLERSFQGQLPASVRRREWMRVDLGTLLHSPGLGIGPLQRSQLAALLPGVTSPLLALGALSRRPGSPEASELVGGVQTQRFRTTANMTATTQLGQLITRIAQAAGSSWQADVWIDNSSLVRKVRFVSPAIPSQGNAVYVVTYEPSSRGSRVSINDPAVTDVFNLTSLRH